jgi:lipoprotein-anchoring transpeptidase ErfK/SrfK
MVVSVIVVGTVVGYQQRRAARLKESSERRAAAAPEKTGAEIPLSAAASADNGLPYILRRQVVYYRTSYPSGTIIIAKPQRFLYVIQPNMAAQRFGIAIGQDCGNTVGLFRISQKEMIQQRAGNSPGSRTLYLDSADYIRGTDTPKSIGGSTAVGCFQLINDEMAFLYDRAALDTKVVIMN